MNPISTDKAPAAIGPYSQAMRSGNWIFTSGQIPVDPASGTIVAEDIEAKSTRCSTTSKPSSPSKG